MHLVPQELSDGGVKVEIERHKTALSRVSLSRPMRLAIEAGVIRSSTTVMDYGCGRGDDVRLLRSQGIACEGWDPAHRSDGSVVEADAVNLGYVVNVIEDEAERTSTLKKAWDLARGTLIVAARLRSERGSDSGDKRFDGVITRRNTFQKFYEQYELKDWIDDTLGTASVAAAPGVFFVFRDAGTRESFLATRWRRRAPRVAISQELYNAHEGLLRPLVDFIGETGRLPAAEELPEAATICEQFGSLKQAFRVIRHVSDEDFWTRAADLRTDDLLVYLALAEFGTGPKYGDLPTHLREDIRAFFGTFKKAHGEAIRLLFSLRDMNTVSDGCEAASFGKRTHDAIYVHSDFVTRLPRELRVYEGCARTLVGHVEGANILKMNRLKPKISYLAYPDFDRTAHPPLDRGVVVSLDNLRVKFFDHSNSTNRPILHRKEEFVPDDYPGRSRFERLTRSEEKRGLFDAPSVIGREDQWEEVLAASGVTIRGHRVLRTRAERGT